jgi:hypothetical protein
MLYELIALVFAIAGIVATASLLADVSETRRAR